MKKKRAFPLLKKIKRILKPRYVQFLYYLFTIIAAFLLQTSIFPLIPFLSATPNLLMIMTFSVGFLHGNFYGMIYGLSAGLLMDMFYSGSFGFYSLIFVCIGYVNGFFSRLYYEEYVILPMIMCAFNELIYHLYIYIFRFLIRGKFSIDYYFLRIVFPSMIFSLLLTLILYRFAFTADKRLRER